MNCIFGVDIGGTNVKLGIISPDGAILDEGSIPTMGDRGPAHVADRAREWLDAHAAPRFEPRAAGIACAGLIDNEKGILHTSPNLPGWEGSDLADIFSAKLSLPVDVENDVNAAAYGEYRCGVGRGTSCFVCVTLGTGVGGGVIVDGALLRGSSGFAGEIGHTVIQIDGPLCSCGRRGHVEALVSAGAIVERARRALRERGAGILRDSDDLTVKDIHEAAVRGDEIAVSVFAETGRFLGYGLTNLIHILDPETIAVGGGIAGAGEFILGPARETVRSNVMDEHLAGVNIVQTELGNAASFTGAALLAAERYPAR